MLSEKRVIEERLEMFEQQTINMSGDGLKRNGSDLSLQSYQENGYATNGDLTLVSYYYTNIPFSFLNFICVVFMHFYRCYKFTFKIICDINKVIFKNMSKP